MVREEPIRRALDQVIDVQGAVMRSLTQSLSDGQLSLAAWQAGMMAATKSVHIVGATVATGGWAQMGQDDWGWVGQRIREQYRFLQQFAADLASGKQALNGTALARSEMYAQAGRATHRAAIERAAKARGLEQERNQLGAADHCAGCLAATAAGWVPIGSLVPCGSRNCLSRCHCSLTYRMVPAA